VVFLTGMGLAAVETFLPAVPRSLRARRLLFVDPFGSGYSDAPLDFGYTLADHARAIADLLRSTLDAGCVLVGYSSGGSIAAVLADEHPELVARLVVAEAALAQGGGSISPWIAAQSEAEFARSGHRQLLERFDPVGAAGPAALHAFFARTAPHALHRTARALVEPLARDVGRRLRELTMPGTYVHGGAAGSELGAADRDVLERSGVRVFSVPGAGHLLPWDAPGGFGRALAAAVA
jgi:pimeloyl-ACP methyl ester carboxylesterase